MASQCHNVTLLLGCGQTGDVTSSSLLDRRFPSAIIEHILLPRCHQRLFRFRDGFLCGGSSTGPFLPPFRARIINHDTPILVNFVATFVRIPYGVHVGPTRGHCLSDSCNSPRTYSLESRTVLSSGVHRRVPGSQPPLFCDLRD